MRGIPTHVKEPTKVIHLKGVTEDLHRRIRVASAQEGISYAKLITLLLDHRDERIARSRRAQASPLHRQQDPAFLDPEGMAM